ncbi:MAG TPA: MmcQ/YjbR family DNA-binding protein [Candidatus Acidoferrum sp.]|nr:MmcQ/YjbR family DNA-binding protein [Candidatus Acidoferrum sp.]
MQQVMDIEWLRGTCLAFADTSEQVQWGYDLVFKVHGKMFAIAPLEPARVVLSFKCTDENFAELTERPEIIPAPYLARAKWVALETRGAVGKEELAELLRGSYEMVLAKIPKRIREAAQKTAAQKDATSKKAKTKRPAARKTRR